MNSVRNATGALDKLLCWVMREKFCNNIEKIIYLFVKQDKKKKKLEGWRRVIDYTGVKNSDEYLESNDRGSLHRVRYLRTR